MNSLMEVKGLAKNYGKVKAVDDVSFSIREGICFGLLGPNGAGKTTTIEMMEGIVTPSRGSVEFRGAPVDASFRKKVGIQFQQTALPEYITVRETIELFSAFYPNPRPIDEIIDICSLADITGRDNKKLSGGQRQRMLLAIAIIPRPEILFLDEPTTGLDPQARRNFWNLINRIKAEKTTIVLTTHYMDEAQILCDEIGIMDHGKIIEIDTPENLLARHFSGVLVRIPWKDDFTSESDINGNCLTDFMKTDTGIEITTTNLDATMKSLLCADINIDGLTIHKPNLEDLFIKLTGSALRS